MKRNPLLILLMLAGLVATLVATTRPAPAGDFRQETEVHLLVVRAYFDDPELVRSLSTWTEPWEVDYDRGYVVVGVSRGDVDRLLEAGFDVELDAEMTALVNRPNVRLPGQGEDTIPGFPCYRTVEGTFASATDIVASYPNLAAWLDVGDSWQKTVGQGGYDMRVLRLTNSAIPGPKPSFFATFAIHAREYTTAELGTRFAEYLVSNYGTDPDVTWILDYHEIHLMLQSNPDGRKQAETGLSWRKNTNNNFCTNTNFRGIDLNRNFEFQWGCCGGSSGNECSETFRGPSPASEPEVQAIQAYGQAIFPDQRGDPIDEPAPPDATGLYIDVHSYSELILWPWGFTWQPTGNGTAHQTLGRKMAYFNGYYPEQSIGLYPTDGTTDDFFYGDLGVASYTYELGTSFFQSCSTFENQILPDNLEALLYAVKVPRTPYLTPAGPEALSVAVSDGLIDPGDPVQLTATLNDARFNNSNGTEPVQNVVAGEYYVDTPPWDGGTPTAMAPADGSFNSPVEGVTAALNTGGLSGGRHLIYVRGQDAAGNWGPLSAVFLYVISGNEGTVEGYLTDALTGEPVGGTVLEPTTNISTSSDPATGFYALSLPQGTWTVEASAAYHLPASFNNVTVVDGAVTPLDIALDPTAGLGLPPDVTSQQPLGSVVERTLRIENLGNAQLDWQLREINGGYIPPAIHTGSVLLVDDDDNSPDVRAYYTAALAALGLPYDVFDVGGGAGNGPTATQMADYDLVIWFSGDQFGSFSDEAGPNATDEVALTTYLSGGGKLFLSSQDYIYDRGNTTFLQNILGVGGYSNDAGDYTSVVGANSFAGLGPYPLNYPGTDYSDILTANANGTIGFVGNNNRNAATYNDDVVFFAFMWEGIYNANSANGLEALTAVVDHLAPPDIPWLTASQTSGSVPGGGFVDVTLTFSATPPDVPANGTYTGTLRILSNDPALPVGEVSVNMIVSDAPPPLASVAYQYAMNDGSNGTGTYLLYGDLTFADGAGSGLWRFLPTPARLLLRHNPGSSCQALSIGWFSSPTTVRGYRLCQDGSGVVGVWRGTLGPGATVDSLRVGD